MLAVYFDREMSEGHRSFHSPVQLSVPGFVKQQRWVLLWRCLQKESNKAVCSFSQAHWHSVKINPSEFALSPRQICWRFS